MNCILSNSSALLYDAVCMTSAGPMYYDDMETFMTPYGLVYPLERGFPILRALQDAASVQELISQDYLRRYTPSTAARAVYLDWNARLWIITWSPARTKDVAFAISQVPQGQHTVLVDIDCNASQRAAVNMALRDCKSYVEVFALLERTTTDRFMEPVCVALEDHKRRKPEGAVNLPNLILHSDPPTSPAEE